MQRAQLTSGLLRAFGGCALITVAGCFSLSRQTPPLEEYVLGQAVRTAPVSSARDTGGVTIGLRRLDLAPYLATVAIVVRNGSRILTSGFRRWAEEPSAGIMRAISASMGGAPGIHAVDVAPWQVQAPHDYLIQLHVSHLEGVMADDSTAEGEVRVTASWEIIRSQDGALVARGEADHREAGWKPSDYRGLVARADQGLNSVAGDLAACIVRLGPIPSTANAAPLASVLGCGAR